MGRFMNDLKAILSAIALVVLGVVLLKYTDAPKWIGWISIAFFGLGGAFFISVKAYEAITGKQLRSIAEEQIRLRDGEDYEVHVSDQGVNLIHVESRETQNADWSDLTEVYAIAIDSFPVGNISWILHKGEDMIEIPWDAKKSNALLENMQSRLPGFDNEAIIEMSSTIHGYKKIWSKS